jgi:DNA-binding transcriptional LysR family regulator
MIESSWLRAFAAFAEDVNLSRTAKRLHLSQPAVHAQLRRLSEELGVALYRRVGRGLALTAAGTEVAAFARELDGRTSDLVARLRGEQRDSAMTLAAGSGALLYVIGEGLRAFTRARTTRIDLLTLDALAAVDAVRSGAAHVGVAAAADPHGLNVSKLTAVEQVLVVRRDHPLAKRRRVTLADLDGERLVLPPPGRPHRIVVEAALRAHGATCTVGAVARGWELAVKLVELGFGAAIVNGCCQLPSGLVARPLRALAAVEYVAFARPGARAEAQELVRALVAHGEAWRARQRRSAPIASSAASVRSAHVPRSTR